MVIEYETKYDEQIKDLLVELQNYIVSLDKEKYNIIISEYREKCFEETFEEISKYQGKFLLAIDNDKIVGLIIGLINNEECSEYDFKAPKRGRISELIVTKNCQARGIGSNLLKVMEKYLESIGCEDILIEVFGYNELAIKFYNKYGYHTRMLEVTKKLKEEETYICKIASLEEINQKWDYEISNHPNDNSWLIWKEDFINGVKLGKRICYYGILNNKIIAEGTAILSKDNAQNSEDLIDDHTAYLTAFRTIDEYKGKGYFSKLYNYMETDLKSKNYKKLTLGVEPSEVKNMKIYFNWGYNNFIKTAYEEYPLVDENSKPKRIMVNYYFKNL